MKESDLIYELRTLSRGDVRLFRNNVGALRDAAGNWVTYGLGVGTSDLIGWRRVLITPDHVGLHLAVFAALEGKSDTGQLTASQHAFIDTLAHAGGIAGVVRSVEDARKLLGLSSAVTEA